MEEYLDRAGFEITFNPTGDGNCSYSSAAQQLGIEAQSVKNVVFDYLGKQQYNMSMESRLV